LASFFGAIQRWFKADLYGRHLGLILQEVGNRRPETLTSFISDVFSIPRRDLRNARFQAEYSFDGKRGRRRADLAIFREDEDEPIVLVEIKYHDKPLPETESKPAQLIDYQAWRNQNKDDRHVLLLSRELYRAEDIEVRRWDALTHHLRPFTEASDLIDMLVKYLEEEGNAMQDINGRALTRYLKRFLCNGKPGANNLNGPVEFSNLLKNMQLISGYFHGHFKTAWKSAGIKVEGENYDRRSKVASIDFDVWNRVKTVKEGRSLVDEFGGLRGDLKDGGRVFVFARHSLGHAQDWLRVSYGMLLDVTPDDNEDAPPKTYLCAEVRGGALYRERMEVWSQRKVNFSWITDDAGRSSVKIEAHLNKLILDAIDQTLSEKLSLLPQQKKALSMLRRSLGSGRQPLLTAAY
jgi:hypothetical protein